jgi:hypothetical protein
VARVSLLIAKVCTTAVSRDAHGGEVEKTVESFRSRTR